MRPASSRYPSQQSRNSSAHTSTEVLTAIRYCLIRCACLGSSLGSSTVVAAGPGSRRLPVFHQRNDDRRRGTESSHDRPSRSGPSAGGSRSCRAHGFLRGLQNPLDMLASFGLSFAAVVLFQQPFPGECLAVPETSGFESRLYRMFAELLALAANFFAVVHDQSGSPASSSVAHPSVVGAP